MSKKIYFISGLGADRRVFSNLTFPSDCELKYLDWITPIPHESLEQYACRMAERIDTSSPFYLIGLSFGGMLCTEIAKRLKPLHTYIISSIPVCTELPGYYRVAGTLKLHQVISLNLAKRSTPLMYKMFGLTTPREKMVFDQIIAHADLPFVKWALSCILAWKNTIKPENLTHIHGTNDHILPIKYAHPDVAIEGGGHMMIVSHAEEISQILLS